MDGLSNWLKYYVRINFCLCTIYFFARVNFHACCVWNTDIFYGEHQRYFLGEKKFLQRFFGFSVRHFDILVPFLHILSLLVLRKNYMRECFSHFYKIKIRKSVKNHHRNLKKTKIAIYRFQKYAQKNLFCSFSTMLKPGFEHVLSTSSNHGLIEELWFKEKETPLSWLKRLNGLAVNARMVANNVGNRYLIIFHVFQNNRNDLRERNQSNHIS